MFIMYDVIGNHAHALLDIFCGLSLSTDHYVDLGAPLKSLWRRSY